MRRRCSLWSTSMWPLNCLPGCFRPAEWTVMLMMLRRGEESDLRSCMYVTGYGFAIWPPTHLHLTLLPLCFLCSNECFFIALKSLSLIVQRSMGRCSSQKHVVCYVEMRLNLRTGLVMEYKHAGICIMYLLSILLCSTPLSNERSVVSSDSVCRPSFASVPNNRTSSSHSPHKSCSQTLFQE